MQINTDSATKNSVCAVQINENLFSTKLFSCFWALLRNLCKILHRQNQSVFSCVKLHVLALTLSVNLGSFEYHLIVWSHLENSTEVQRHMLQANVETTVRQFVIQSAIRHESIELADLN